LGGREMGDMQAASRRLRKLYISIHDDSFGGSRHAAQSQTKRGGAFMHAAVLGESSVLGVLNDGKVQLGSAAQGLLLSPVQQNRLATIRDRYGGSRAGGSRIEPSR